jgi:hypothetical protein
MFNPLVDDLSNLKDNEIEEKIIELNKKYFVAARLGNLSLLTQLSNFITMYKQELSVRYAKRSREQNDDDLGQLINVD